MMDVVLNHSNQNITELINTSYEVSRYIIFSTFVLSRLLYLQVFFPSDVRSQTPATYISPTVPGTKFHIHVKQKVKLQALRKFSIF